MKTVEIQRGEIIGEKIRRGILPTALQDLDGSVLEGFYPIFAGGRAGMLPPVNLIDYSGRVFALEDHHPLVMTILFPSAKLKGNLYVPGDTIPVITAGQSGKMRIGDVFLRGIENHHNEAIKRGFPTLEDMYCRSFPQGNGHVDHIRLWSEGVIGDTKPGESED